MNISIAQGPTDGIGLEQKFIQEVSIKYIFVMTESTDSLSTW